MKIEERLERLLLLHKKSTFDLFFEKLLRDLTPNLVRYVSGICSDAALFKNCYFLGMAIVSIPSDSDFTLDNLPYGVFTTEDNPTPRIGVAIGDHILDLNKVAFLFDGPLMKSQQVLLTA